MVSDGGHFENLAAYELIRRRCRVIIISDGECDPRLTFEGLGTLIRMCEVDFGATITIDVERHPPGPATPAWSKRRCAVGEIIRRRQPTASLIYLKASMTGQRRHVGPAVQGEPRRRFPHETTGDQFYGEDQFESYRHLGRDIGYEVFGPLANEPKLVAAAEKLRWPHPRPDTARRRAGTVGFSNGKAAFPGACTRIVGRFIANASRNLIAAVAEAPGGSTP